MGIIVGEMIGSKYKLTSKRRTVKQGLSIDDNIMLKESMVRNIFYKMQKYKATSDLKVLKEIKQRVESLDNLKKEKNEHQNIRFLIISLERAYKKITGRSMPFKDIVEEKIKEVESFNAR